MSRGRTHLYQMSAPGEGPPKKPTPPSRSNSFHLSNLSALMGSLSGQQPTTSDVMGKPPKGHRAPMIPVRKRNPSTNASDAQSHVTEASVGACKVRGSFHTDSAMEAAVGLMVDFVSNATDPVQKPAPPPATLSATTSVALQQFVSDMLDPVVIQASADGISELIDSLDPADAEEAVRLAAKPPAKKRDRNKKLIRLPDQSTAQQAAPTGEPILHSSKTFIYGAGGEGDALRRVSRTTVFELFPEPSGVTATEERLDALNALMDFSTLGVMVTFMANQNPQHKTSTATFLGGISSTYKREGDTQMARAATNCPLWTIQSGLFHHLMKALMYVCVYVLTDGNKPSKIMDILTHTVVRLIPATTLTKNGREKRVAPRAYATVYFTEDQETRTYHTLDAYAQDLFYMILKIEGGTREDLISRVIKSVYKLVDAVKLSDPDTVELFLSCKMSNVTPPGVGIRRWNLNTVYKPIKTPVGKTKGIEEEMKKLLACIKLELPLPPGAMSKPPKKTCGKGTRGYNINRMKRIIELEEMQAAIHVDEVEIERCRQNIAMHKLRMDQYVKMCREQGHLRKEKARREKARKKNRRSAKRPRSDSDFIVPDHEMEESEESEESEDSESEESGYDTGRDSMMTRFDPDADLCNSMIANDEGGISHR